MQSLPSPWNTYAASIEHCADIAALEAVELELFSRKHGAMTLALKALGNLSAAERRRLGEELNGVKKALATLIAERESTLKKQALDDIAVSDRLDATLHAPLRPHGHLHLIPSFIEQISTVFGRMGFDVAVGPEVESEEWNFDLLNFQKDHAARDMQATFWVKNGPDGESRVLRTHTSPVQVRYMRSHAPPFRMICPGKTYRKDADATHSPMFHQCEGLMIGKDVSLAHMKGVMTAAIRELISKDLVFRFRTSYFPFVEPGLEVDMRWRGSGESREGRWMEVAGCGMVHSNVLKNCNIDPEEWQGFAFGFGVERLLMIKHQIPDLRSFYEGDLRFLAQF